MISAREIGKVEELRKLEVELNELNKVSKDLNSKKVSIEALIVTNENSITNVKSLLSRGYDDLGKILRE